MQNFFVCCFLLSSSTQLRCASWCLSEALSRRVKADAILCTDGSAATAATAKEMGVHHEAMNLSAGERVRGAWHIQNVNAYHGRLRG